MLTVDAAAAESIDETGDGLRDLVQARGSVANPFLGATFDRVFADGFEQ